MSDVERLDFANLRDEDSDGMIVQVRFTVLRRVPRASRP